MPNFKVISQDRSSNTMEEKQQKPPNIQCATHEDVKVTEIEKEDYLSK